MKTNIQWPRAKYWDRAWNPIIGCKPISPACENCYAAAWAKRFGQSFEPHKTTHENPPRTGVVFCGNMTDLFGVSVLNYTSFDYFSPSATYLWLTKRAECMAADLGNASRTVREDGNHYFGFTAENQEWYDRRFSEFRKIPTRFKGWLSAEPLLGPIDLGLDHVCPPEAAPFQWLVVGCESGPNRRPCKIEWIEGIVEQCQSAGVPVFVKQLDIGGKCVTEINKFPEHLRIRQVPWNRADGKEAK